jgi:hypothetical protein
MSLLLPAAELRRIGVNVFGMASRKESIILQLKVGGWGRLGRLRILLFSGCQDTMGQAWLLLL